MGHAFMRHLMCDGRDDAGLRIAPVRDADAGLGPQRRVRVRRRRSSSLPAIARPSARCGMALPPPRSVPAELAGARWRKRGSSFDARQQGAADLPVLDDIAQRRRRTGAGRPAGVVVMQEQAADPAGTVAVGYPDMKDRLGGVSQMPPDADARERLLRTIGDGGTAAVIGLAGHMIRGLGVDDRGVQAGFGQGDAQGQADQPAAGDRYRNRLIFRHLSVPGLFMPDFLPGVEQSPGRQSRSLARSRTGHWSNRGSRCGFRPWKTPAGREHFAHEGSLSRDSPAGTIGSRDSRGFSIRILGAARGIARAIGRNGGGPARGFDQFSPVHPAERPAGRPETAGWAGSRPAIGGRTTADAAAYGHGGAGADRGPMGQIPSGAGHGRVSRGCARLAEPALPSARGHGRSRPAYPAGGGHARGAVHDRLIGRA